jgi:hypothetical protein
MTLNDDAVKETNHLGNGMIILNGNRASIKEAATVVKLNPFGVPNGAVAARPFQFAQSMLHLLWNRPGRPVSVKVFSEIASGNARTFAVR